MPSKTPRRSLTGTFFRLLVAACVGALTLLSVRTRRRLALAIGEGAFLVGIRRRVTLDNLARALPELTDERRREIARGAYANMALTALEALFGQTLNEEQLKEAVTFDDWDVVERTIAAGQGLLVATAHFGGWELFAEVMARRGVRLNAVVRPLAGAFNEALLESRRDAGVKLIFPKGAIGESVKALRKGEVVAMLIDQAMPADRGVFVPFFGRPASTSPALSAAARRSGAPVFVMLAAREQDSLRIHLEGPFPVPNTSDRHGDLVAHTAQLTAVIEGYIRRYPDQWLWLHRRWKVRPPDQMLILAPTPNSNVGAGTKMGGVV